MSLNYNNRLLLFKLATGSYPDAATGLDAGTDAIETFDLNFDPASGATEVLDPDRPNLGAGKEVNVGPHGKLTFRMRAAGSGTAGTAPALGNILRACGWVETVEVGTSVTYNLTSSRSAFEWGSAVFFHDGELITLNGVRGNAVPSFNAGQTPMFDVELWGLWDTTATAGNYTGTLDLSNFLEGLPVNAANTPTFTVDSYAAFPESLTLNPGYDVQYRNTPGTGGERILVVDREGSGSLNIEDPGVAAKDFYALASGTNPPVVDIQLVHGTQAGDILTVNAKAQLKRQSNTNSQNLSVIPFNLRLVPTDAGDDELELVFT